MDFGALEIKRYFQRLDFDYLYFYKPQKKKQQLKKILTPLIYIGEQWHKLTSMLIQKTIKNRIDFLTIFSLRPKYKISPNLTLQKKLREALLKEKQNKLDRLQIFGQAYQKHDYNKHLLIQKQQKKQENTQTKLRDRINNIFAKQSYVLFCKTEKQISSEIMYFLKCLQYSQKITESVEKLLKKLMNTIFVYVKVNQRQKYLHRFCLFMYITKKYALLTGQNYDVKPQQINLLKAKKNKNASYTEHLEQSIITEDEAKFLKSEKINEFLVQLAANEVKLQNNQCICCSEVFVRGLELKNFNPFFQKVIPISSKQSLEEFVTVKYINAICNFGGGVLLIGVQKIDNLMIAQGIKFKSQESIDLIQQQIENSIKIVRPKCWYKLERVLVHTQYTKKQQVALQFMRICFRIIILPQSLKKLTYSQLNLNFSETLYQSFNFQKDNSITRLSSSQVYQKMHKIYKNSKQSLINCHKNVVCLSPYPYYSQTFYQMYNNGSISPEELYPDLNNSDEEFGDQNLDDDPKFKFRYQSLIVVGSANMDKYVEKFVEFLQAEKIQNYDILRPFVSSFLGKKMRSLWLLSHGSEYSRIRQLLKQYTKLSNSQEHITIMPIQQILQVKSTKFTQTQQKYLNKRLLIRYNTKKCYKKQQISIYDNKEGKQKQMCFLKFKNKYMALFAYMVFQELFIRPYFVNQDQFVSKI